MVTFKLQISINKMVKIMDNEKEQLQQHVIIVMMMMMMMMMMMIINIIKCLS